MLRQLHIKLINSFAAYTLSRRNFVLNIVHISEVWHFFSLRLCEKNLRWIVDVSSLVIAALPIIVWQLHFASQVAFNPVTKVAYWKSTWNAKPNACKGFRRTACCSHWLPRSAVWWKWTVKSTLKCRIYSFRSTVPRSWIAKWASGKAYLNKEKARWFPFFKN